MSATKAAEARRPLAGLRVVEVGQVLAAPYAGMILADLGAEVIKVEKPGIGDDARTMGPAFRGGASMTFHEVNRGKRSVVVDLKTDAGREAFMGLLPEADIVIHNLRPGEPQRLGIDAGAVMARYPHLIYCDISAFGHLGPRRLQPGYEPLLQAFSGLISVNGSEGAPPARLGVSVVDQGTAMWAVIAMLSALRERDATGQGTVIHTSLLETALAWGSSRVHGELNEGRRALRQGTGHPGLVPYQVFDTADDPVMICAGNDRLFARLAQAMQRPEWASDSRYATNRQRLQHREELVAAMQARLRERSREEWIAAIEAVGVPVAPVNSIAQAVRDPQVAALDILQQVPDEAFVLTALPFSLGGERPRVGAAAPALGEHDARYLGTHRPTPE